MKKLLLMPPLIASFMVVPLINSHAEETSDDTTIEQVVANDEIQEIFDAFQIAGLPVINPQPVLADELGDEPYLTDNVYAFGVVPNEQGELLMGTLYALEDDDNAQVLLDYYETADFATHVAQAEHLVLIFDGDIAEEIFNAYVEVLRNPDQALELEMDLSVVFDIQIHHELETGEAEDDEDKVSSFRRRRLTPEEFMNMHPEEQSFYMSGRPGTFEEFAARKSEIMNAFFDYQQALEEYNQGLYPEDSPPPQEPVFDDYADYSDWYYDNHDHIEFYDPPVDFREDYYYEHHSPPIFDEGDIEEAEE